MPEPRDETIRRRMQRQRRRDTARELEIRRALHALGYRFRVDYRMEPSLRTRGDIVFTRRRLVVFVDGCFWHGCPEHATAPKTNAEWWRENSPPMSPAIGVWTRAYRLGWTVLRIWEHEPLGKCVRRMRVGL